MALAKRAGGEAGVFWVVPLSAGFMVLATYGLGRRLASARVGLVAAWFLATSPVFLYMLMWPMSDVPVAAAWTVTFVLLLGHSKWHSIGAGAACAIAVTIRPNLAPWILAPVLWYSVLVWREGRGERRRAMWQLARFSVSAAAGPIAIGAIFAYLYGSPFQSGYGDVSGMFSRSHIIPNLRNYATWFIDTQTPIAVLGLLALFVPLRSVWPQAPALTFMPLLGVFVLGLLGYYSAYLVFDTWWFLRFLLPVWPLVMVGLASVALAATRLRVPWLTAAIVIGVGLLGLRGLRVSSERFAFDLWEGERRYIAAATNTRALTPDNSVVFSLLHSGSARFYGGRVTLRFDELDRSWLDRSVEWLSERGVQAYLLVDDLEITQFRERFAGQATLARLDGAPVFTYAGSQRVFLYNLGQTAGVAGPGITLVGTSDARRAAAPVPQGRLTLQKR
jgi:4-amino-4-deoxy-L-arabinose transferase-like glycosyltransferase